MLGDRFSGDVVKETEARFSGLSPKKIRRRKFNGRTHGLAIKLFLVKKFPVSWEEIPLMQEYINF